jgi:hypothetical protein
MEHYSVLLWLKECYGDKINPALEDVWLWQDENTVYVEVEFNDGTENKINDLSFIDSDKPFKNEETGEIECPPFFHPADDPSLNGIRLVETDPFTLMLCIPDIYTKDGEEWARGLYF